MTSFNNMVTVTHCQERKEKWPNYRLTFHSDIPHLTTVPCHLCHPWAHATAAPQTSAVLSFCPVYEEENSQSFLLAMILDPNHNRTGEMRRWQGPVQLKALMCFVHDTLHCCQRQELTDERGRKRYPKANRSIRWPLRRSWLYILECLMFRKFILVKAQENVCFYFTQSKNIGQREIKKWK